MWTVELRKAWRNATEDKLWKKSTNQRDKEIHGSRDTKRRKEKENTNDWWEHNATLQQWKNKREYIMREQWEYTKRTKEEYTMRTKKNTRENNTMRIHKENTTKENTDDKYPKHNKRERETRLNYYIKTLLHH